MTVSPQEEEVFALRAVERLGEPSAHEVALELGVPTCRNTLSRLEHKERVERFRTRNASQTGDVWRFRVRTGTQGQR